MRLSGGVSDSLGVSKSLEALALRKRAECEVEDGNFSQADLLLSKAIELKPCGGIHIIFKDRCSTSSSTLYLIVYKSSTIFPSNSKFGNNR